MRSQKQAATHTADSGHLHWAHDCTRANCTSVTVFQCVISLRDGVGGCPIFCERGLGLQVVRESVGVSHSYLVDGLFPAGGLRAFNIAVGFDVAFCFLRSLGSALFFDVADHQPKRLQRRGIVRELAPVVGGFTQFKR